MTTKTLSQLATTVAAAALLLANAATATGATVPTMLFQGGTKAEQAQVIKALAASTFDWRLLPQTVTVHIANYGSSYATAGDVYLDAQLLDSGTFAWGVVLHEFGHQVDFLVLPQTGRDQLDQLLGGVAWNGGQTTAHDQIGAERFASVFAWTYWQNAENAISPKQASEAAAATPAAFQAALATALGVTTTTAPVRALKVATALTVSHTGLGLTITKAAAKTTTTNAPALAAPAAKAPVA